MWDAFSSPPSLLIHKKLRIFIQISDQSLPVLPSFLSSSSSSPSSPSPPPRFVSWLQVLQQIEDGEIACALQSNIIKEVYNLNLMSKDATGFNHYYLQSDADQYTLVFANCLPHLKVSMDVRSDMYKLDGKTNTRDYLSARITVLPRACDCRGISWTWGDYLHTCAIVDFTIDSILDFTIDLLCD
ncbi:hypothetical protein LXL04_012990 [Taraxacum kok-saghyz]